MVRTILATGILIVLGAYGAVAQEALKPGDFNSAKSCQPCHEEIYAQWQTSYHSKAATDPVYWKLFEAASKEVGSRASAHCLTCHSPIATTTGEVQFHGDVSFPLELSDVAKEGVTCDYCHTISGNENLGANVSVGAYRVPHRGNTVIKYGSHDDASSPAHETKRSEFLTDPAFCGICHKYTHTLPGNLLQNTYQEWASGPYPDEGKRCQDCHMPRYTGRSATGAPERDDLNAHRFAGGHSEMLKDAARVELAAEVRGRSSKRLRVRATVTNVASGHAMPTGIPGIRELWLEVRASGTDGAELGLQRVRYGMELLDKQGQPAMPWTAVRAGRDTRLWPRKSRRTTVEIPLTGSSGGTVEVRGVLYYRAISERVAERIGEEPSELIEVANATTSVTP